MALFSWSVCGRWASRWRYMIACTGAVVHVAGGWAVVVVELAQLLLQQQLSGRLPPRGIRQMAAYRLNPGPPIGGHHDQPQAGVVDRVLREAIRSLLSGLRAPSQEVDERVRSDRRSSCEGFGRVALFIPPKRRMMSRCLSATPRTSTARRSLSTRSRTIRPTTLEPGQNAGHRR